MTPFEEIAELLARLQQADAAGDREAAFRIAWELLHRLQRWRREESIREAGDLDLALLDRLGTELHRRGYHEEAGSLFDAARHFAQGAGRSGDARLFLLKSIPCLVANLEFTEARSRVECTLGRRLSEPEACRESAARLDPRDWSDADRSRGRVLALYGLGRLLAALGHLGEADRTLGRAVEVGRRSRRPEGLGVDLDEVALLQAEVRLDRGDFRGFEALAGSVRPDSRLARDKWQILRATVDSMQGRFSRADEILRGVSAGIRPSALPPCYVGAVWHRIQILAVLNRLGEAEKLARRLRAAPGASLDGLKQLRRLIRARRTSTFTDLGVPPAAIEALDGAPAGDRRPGGPAASLSLLADEDLTSTRRMYERVRDECTWRANQVRLCLHYGQFDRAFDGLVLLKVFAEATDSELIAAQRESATALCAYYFGDMDACLDHAGKASEKWVDLDMPASEWQVCRLMTWASRRKGEGRDVVQGIVDRERRLMDRILADLGPDDRISIRLNKASIVDETISGWCLDLARAEAEPGPGDARDRLRRSRRALEVL